MSALCFFNGRAYSRFFAASGARSFNLVLVQGLNRQIRRMCEALGYNVMKLRRVRINRLRIGKLRPGEWRELTEAERNGLMASIKDSSGRPLG